MPKEGRRDSEWRKILSDYAAGKVQFGKGQMPKKLWAKQAMRSIDACPARHGRDVYGQRTDCSCGYHKVLFIYFVSVCIQCRTGVIYVTQLR